MRRTLGVIPARMSSSRFPGKPLEKIFGVPMIAHCYERALLSNTCDELVIATPDKEIMDWAKKYDIPTILTSHSHERATERAAEVTKLLEQEGQFYDYILLLQGDEPQIFPNDIKELKKAFSISKSDVVNLIYPIHGSDLSDANVVKAIITKSNKISFFTRAHVPYGSKKGIRQLGMIGFTRDALLNYAQLEMTELEILESIDMMRFLENDIPIFAALSSFPIIGVDNPSDIQKVESMMKNDTFLIKYKKKYLEL